MTGERRILVAGIGNIFFGDDAFGVEVVRRLKAHPLRREISAVDFGIRGIDLSYALLEEYDSVILVDAVRHGGAPGTLYLLEIGEAQTACTPNLHGLDPANALGLAKAMGAKLENIVLIGCEPEAFVAESDEVRLSPSVAAAIDSAVAWVREVVDDHLREKP